MENNIFVFHLGNTQFETRLDILDLSFLGSLKRAFSVVHIKLRIHLQNECYKSI